MRMMVRFGKEARLRFISHLDLQRFLHMALNRTGLPIKYSQGFNPHAVMAFGSALGLYQTSEYEVLDISLSAPMGRKRCEDAMRAALPQDMPIYEVRLIDDRFPSVMSQVWASDYHVWVRDDEAAKRIAESIEGFMAQDTIIAMKKTKSGEKEINIRPLILELKPTEDGFDAKLMATERESLKAGLLVQQLALYAGIDEPETLIRRMCLYGRTAEGEIKPVMQL